MHGTIHEHSSGTFSGNVKGHITLEIPDFVVSIPTFIIQLPVGALVVPQVDIKVSASADRIVVPLVGAVEGNIELQGEDHIKLKAVGKVIKETTVKLDG